MSALLLYITLLAPLAVVIAYYDVRYRRIPNAFVLAALVGGLTINAIFAGFSGLLASLSGCALAFFPLFILHIFGAMGAGDVKLFAAVGAIVGAGLVLPTLLIVMITGGVIAVYSMIRAGTVRATMQRVLMILVGLLPGWQMPRFAVPADRRHTIPYGVAIMIGSLISVALFRA
ncbi:MAG TPA: A24 family peptidase [Pyrinomonadaceae bacterium]|nr:A24 family peptidase [Pyrinomonadaceae bacterium]